jgi:hypothetical protein
MSEDTLERITGMESVRDCSLRETLGGMKNNLAYGLMAPVAAAKSVGRFLGSVAEVEEKYFAPFDLQVINLASYVAGVSASLYATSTVLQEAIAYQAEIPVALALGLAQAVNTIPNALTITRSVVSGDYSIETDSQTRTINFKFRAPPKNSLNEVA